MNAAPWVGATDLDDDDDEHEHEHEKSGERFNEAP
jgi:hypothetical protein